MVFVPFQIPPGVVKADAENTLAGRWVDAQWVRFFRNNPEKINGWEKTVVDTFTGVVRNALGWSRNNGQQQILFGTASDLFLLSTGGVTEITPWGIDQSSIALTDPFETANTSTTIIVTDSNHGLSEIGLKVSFTGATAVGGVTVDGEYTITSIPDANTFTIEHASPATSNDTGGGSVTASYELQAGNVSTEYLTGWGVGGWGEGGWGTPRQFSTTPSPLRTWSIASYGEDAFINPLNGGIYYYDSSAGASRPTQVLNAPTECRALFVTGERYLMALGCTDASTGLQDAMVVRWPDVDDFTDWTPTSTNTSNQRRLNGGSKLVAGTKIGNGISLVWSNNSCFQFQFTGSNAIYSSKELASKCGLISPMAFATHNGMAFWLSDRGFHVYTGYIQDIANSDDIKEFFFNNLNDSHKDKCFLFFNSKYREIWFMYPSGVNEECSAYLIYDIDSQSWTLGNLNRTAYSRLNSSDNSPVLFSEDGSMYTHELPYSKNGDGEAITARLKLAPLEVQAGNLTVDIMGYVPDMERQVGDVALELEGMDHPRGAVLDTDSLTIEPTDEIVDARIAGRQIAATFISNEIDGDFRLGQFGLEISPAGNQR